MAEHLNVPAAAAAAAAPRADWNESEIDRDPEGQFVAGGGGGGGGGGAAAKLSAKSPAVRKQVKQQLQRGVKELRSKGVVKTITEAASDLGEALSSDKYLATRETEAAHEGVAEHLAEVLKKRGMKAEVEGTTVKLAGGGSISVGAHGARHYAGAEAAQKAIEEDLANHPSTAVQKWTKATGHTSGAAGSENPDHKRYYERALTSAQEMAETLGRSTVQKWGASVGRKLVQSGIRRGTKATFGRSDADAVACARVQRFDRGTLRPAEKLDNGWLRVEGMTARCGVLEYEDGSGKVRRELVLPEELGDPASLATAHMVPVTNRHPDALLNDKTARDHQVGSVGENVRMDGEYLAAGLMITDGDTVRAVEIGRQQLSWGYDCRLDAADPSLFAKWGQHDGIQRDRRYNHLAIVDEARAGAGARLRLDGSAAHMVEVQAEPANPAKEPPMSQIVIAGHRFDAKPEAVTLIQQAIDREFADLRARLDGLTAEKSTAEKSAAAQKRRADGILKAAKGKISRVRALFDAMKARMMGCDECASSEHGAGKVDDGEGNPAKCEYCGGSGKVRMHDEIKAAVAAEPEEGHPADDLEEIDEELKEEDGLEREPAEEEDLEVAANAKHKDRADRARRRKDAARPAQQKRADSIGRMIASCATARAALLATAAKYLPAEKFDGKADLEVKRAVLKALAPHLDADKLEPSAVKLFYGAEVKRADGAGGGFTASDQLRAGMGAQPIVAPRRLDAAEDRARATADAKANAWQKPMQQPETGARK